MRIGTKYRAQMYTIRKPSYHLRKLVLAVHSVYLVHFGLFQFNQVYFGPIQFTPVQFNALRSTLVQLGPFQCISVHFNPFGPLGPFRSTSFHFGLLQSTLVHISPFCPFRSTSIHSIQFYILSFFPYFEYMYIYIVSKPNQPCKRHMTKML